MRKSPRQRRLEADFRSVEELDAESSIFSFNASGDPPTRYRLLFEGPGICRGGGGEIQIIHKHEVIVELGAAYPRMVPNLLWQTPIFHPNISNNGVVCLGGYGTHWVPSLTLDEMSTMLWDMIRYKNFDIQSPYNRDAALWARDQRLHQFPLDDRNIRDLVNKPKQPSHQFQTPAESVEEPKSRNGKSVFGVLGALANRFRDRANQSDAAAGAQQIHVNEDVHVVEVPEEVEAQVEEIEEVEEAIAEQSVMIDPLEIEIIEDGISFIEPEDNKQAAATNDSAMNPSAMNPSAMHRGATNRNADAEDTGIVFLD